MLGESAIDDYGCAAEAEVVAVRIGEIPAREQRRAERAEEIRAHVVARHPHRFCVYAFDRRVFLHPPVDPWPFLGRIEAPALVVHGAHSPIMSAESAGRVAAAIPRGEAATLAGAHHHLVVEEPIRFAEIVLRWSDLAIFRVQS